MKYKVPNGPIPPNNKGYIWSEMGDANHYRICKDKNWFAVIKMNGKILSPTQELRMEEIVAALNNDFPKSLQDILRER